MRNFLCNVFVILENDIYLKSFAKEWHVGDFSRVLCEFDGQEHEVKNINIIYVSEIYFIFNLVHKLCHLKRGRWGVKKCQLHLVKRRLRGRGGRKLPILRRRSLWTAPNHAVVRMLAANQNNQEAKQQTVELR